MYRSFVSSPPDDEAGIQSEVRGSAHQSHRPVDHAAILHNQPTVPQSRVKVRLSQVRVVEELETPSSGVDTFPGLIS